MTLLYYVGANSAFTKGQLERELKRIGMEKTNLPRDELQHLKHGEMM